MQRAVSAWLGERRITPRSPRWMTIVRSEAVQRMTLAAKGNALFPSLPVTPAIFGEAELVGRRDARTGIFADLFDG